MLKHFQKHISKHIMTWLFKKSQHARLNIDAAAALLLAKKTICVQSSQLSGSILKCVTFATCSRFLLTINYFQVVDVDWPLVSMRILKTKWSPRWLAGCTALNVGCRGAASLAWRGRGRWGIRPPPGVAHGLTCSPFLASRLPLLRRWCELHGGPAGEWRRTSASAIAGRGRHDWRLRGERRRLRCPSVVPPPSVGWYGAAAAELAVACGLSRTTSRSLTTQGRIAKRRFERGSLPNTRG